jgi:hypothetical protein
MARALVSAISFGGVKTGNTNFPSGPGLTVSDGIGLAPGVLGINHNCHTRLPPGTGTC